MRDLNLQLASQSNIHLIMEWHAEKRGQASRWVFCISQTFHAKVPHCKNCYLNAKFTVSVQVTSSQPWRSFANWCWKDMSPDLRQDEDRIATGEHTLVTLGEGHTNQIVAMHILSHDPIINLMLLRAKSLGSTFYLPCEIAFLLCPMLQPLFSCP